MSSTVYQVHLRALGFTGTIDFTQKGATARKKRFLQGLNEEEIIALLGTLEMELLRHEITTVIPSDDFNYLCQLLMKKSISMRREGLKRLINSVSKLCDAGRDTGRARVLVNDLNKKLIHKISGISSATGKIVNGGGGGNGTGMGDR